MFAHLSPGRAPKSLAWALGDATDVFPSEDLVVGAVIRTRDGENRVTIDGVDVVGTANAADAVLLWTVSIFVFSMKYGPGAATSRFIAANVLCVDEVRPKDRASKKLRAEIEKAMHQDDAV